MLAGVWEDSYLHYIPGVDWYAALVVGTVTGAAAGAVAVLVGAGVAPPQTKSQMPIAAMIATVSLFALFNADGLLQVGPAIGMAAGAVSCAYKQAEPDDETT